MSDIAQAEIAPVEAAQRIKTLDVLRGLAILGILVVNAPFFSAPWQTAINPTLQPLAIDDANAWTWLLSHIFFEVKFITLFSLLFGVSVFLVGGERSDKERGKVLHRRLGWMLLFGIIHGAAIWYGDILVVYAVSGLIVMLARSWRPRTLMIVGCVVYALLAGVSLLGAMALSYVPAEALEQIRVQVWSPEAPTLAATIAGFGGSFMDSLRANFGNWTFFVSHELMNTVPRTIAVMMIGLALFKWGFFSGAARVWVYGLVIVIGAAALAAVAYQAQLNLAAGFDFMHMQSGGALLNPALSIFITLMYASLFILCVKFGVLGFFTNALAPVGQMAFTNYIAQSLFMTMIFYGGRGLGWYGEVNRETLLVIVAAIWTAQLIWSPIWLSKFRMGPLEWVWRRLSYGKPLAIAKSAAA